MHDDSDDGENMREENYYIKTKSYINNKDEEQKIDYLSEEENYGMYNYSNNIDNNSIYDYSYYADYNICNYFKKRKGNYRKYYEDKQYDDSFNQEFDEYNTNYYNNKKNYNHKKKYAINVDQDNYLATFKIMFKSWLLKTLFKDKKKIVFSKNKKVNKEIKESLKKINELNSNKKNDQANIRLIIRDEKIEPIIRNEINLEFKIIIIEELEVFFIKKYIEIKVIGKIAYNKKAKFYFIMEQFKISLLDGTKSNNDSKEIKVIEKNEDDKLSEILELDLHDKNNNNSEESKENNENNFDNYDSEKELKICLNGLVKCY